MARSLFFSSGVCSAFRCSYFLFNYDTHCSWQRVYTRTFTGGLRAQFSAFRTDSLVICHPHFPVGTGCCAQSDSRAEGSCPGSFYPVFTRPAWPEQKYCEGGHWTRLIEDQISAGRANPLDPVPYQNNPEPASWIRTPSRTKPPTAAGGFWRFLAQDRRAWLLLPLVDQVTKVVQAPASIDRRSRSQSDQHAAPAEARTATVLMELATITSIGMRLYSAPPSVL